MSFQLFIQALQARRSGPDWMANCPGHDDRTPSLSIREVGGKILFHCHAGCSQKAVLDALRARGLWQPLQTGQRPIVTTYDYTDEQGALLYQVVRYDPKDFSQRRPDGHGGWIWKKGPRQVLYRLREVLEAPIIFVVEGERDVETLRDYGFVATTNAGGAKAPWLPQYTNWLVDKEVILIPDNDPPGKQRVLKIARALAGRVARLIVIELKGAKDVTAWFEHGHAEVELIALVEGQEVNQ